MFFVERIYRKSRLKHDIPRNLDFHSSQIRNARGLDYLRFLTFAADMNK